MLDRPTTAAPVEHDPTDSARPQQPQIDYRGKGLELALRCLSRARSNATRKLRDRQDWFDLLMYAGGAAQWQIWDGQRYVERGTDPALGGIPAYIPRCTTNVFANKIDGIAAILNQSAPAKECGPGDDTDADRAAATVAQDALPVLLDELRYEQDRGQIHKLICLTSLVGYLVYYDNDARHGTDTILAHQCSDPSCAEYALPDELDEAGNCPQCGGATAPAMDPRTQQPIGVDYPKGKLCGEIIPSFELSLPPGARTSDPNRLPWVATHTRMATEDIVRAWPTARPLVAGWNARDVSSGGSNSSYADALTGLVSPTTGEGSTAHQAQGPVVYRVWHDPIDDGEFSFPDGLQAVLIDDQLVDAGPLEFKDEDGRPIKNLVIRQFVPAPGTAYGKPPADDLAPLQTQRNIIESLALLSLMHFAAPKEYVPLSVTLENEPTGAPGERVFYRSSVPGEKPTVVAGTSPAEGLYKQLEIIDQKMQEISKLNAVLQGERPAGNPTLGEIQLLREQGQGAFKDPIDQLVQFETDLCLLALRVARQTMWTERFRKIHGENGQWEVKKFLGADLEGRVDVYIDHATAWPKSPLMHALRVQDALKMGVLPPPAQDPELAAKLLTDMDLADLKPSVDVDRKQIARELDVWKRAQSPQEIAPPDPLTQNLKLHFALKQSFLKTEEAEAIKQQAPPVFDAMRAHLQQIQQLLAPPPVAEPGAPGPSPLDALVKKGVLQPAKGAPAAPASPMSHLVHAGVLTPAAAPASEGSRA